MNVEALISAAWEVRENAHAPYSNFKVGAALVSACGRIYTGCNVENLSFGLTNCAERVAVGSGIADGVKRFETIVIVADTKTPISPCGACRQVLAEFGVGKIVLANREETLEFSLNELLPRSQDGILDGAD
ncbi:MAG: cytidine deaminase [Akkermansiaceae bacterium]